MIRLVRLSLGRLAAHPLRMTLVVLTVGLGTTVVSLSLSLRSSLGRLERSILPDRGTRVVVGNGSHSIDGIWEWETPPRFVAADGPEILLQTPDVIDITPYQQHGWPSVYANGRSWKLRSVGGAGHGYGAIMGLEMAAGTFFTPEDEEARERVVVLSESAARTMFGDPDGAMGQDLVASTGAIFRAVRLSPDGGMAGDEGPVMLKETYRVVGVYRDPSRLQRETYGIPEAVIPHVATLPAGVSMDPPVRTFVALVRADQPDKVQPAIRASLASTYGDEVEVTVWIGSPGSPPGPSGDPRREGLRTFSMVVSVLSAIILLLSGFGVFSALMAEGADAGRESGIFRALGASVRTLRLLVLARAAVLGLLGGLLGVAGALALRPAVWGVLGQLMEGFGIGAGVVGTRPSPWTFPVALSAAVAASALFGLLPAWRAGSTSITESIRDS